MVIGTSKFGNLCGKMSLKNDGISNFISNLLGTDRPSLIYIAYTKNRQILRKNIAGNIVTDNLHKQRNI